MSMWLQSASNHPVCCKPGTSGAVGCIALLAQDQACGGLCTPAAVLAELPLMPLRVHHLLINPDVMLMLLLLMVCCCCMPPLWEMQLTWHLCS